MSSNQRNVGGACLHPCLTRLEKMAPLTPARPAPRLAAFGLSVILALVFVGAGCRSAPSLAPTPDDPFFESFFEKASLIMTDDEVEIYRSLPDPESKASFIEDFWKSRDVDPTTEENEGRAEFERRVAFANAWFSDSRTLRAKAMTDGKEKSRGWQTDPGRVYILLGPPEYLADENGMLEPFDPTRLYRRSEPVPIDAVSSGESMTWVYERKSASRPQLYVYFYRSGSGGRWRSNIFSSRDGRDAIEKAKLNYLAADLQDAVKVPFRGRVDYVRGAVALRFRTSSVNYAEQEGKLVASLKVKIVVYRDGRREDVVEKVQDFSFTEEELLAMKDLEFSVPCQPRGRGRYLFDITVTDMKSLRFATFRTYLRKNV